MTVAKKTQSIPDLIDGALSISASGMAMLRQFAAQPEMQAALNAAVETILTMKGRLIVTGLGKSGHVGTKLAATFSSTGTPSFFVHPSEASHGDLGMIQADDVVLMLSWSGSTRELSDLVAYTSRFDVPLIIITGSAKGDLVPAADVAVVLPKAREACPHNLAPTTSTLMQLAIGDAIAVTLLQLKGFSESSFYQFHPGGKLGASLAAVEDFAARDADVPLVQEDTPVMGVVDEMSDKNLGIVGVVDAAGLLLGVVTDGDMRRYLGRSMEKSMKEAMQTTLAREVMTPGPISLSPGTLAARALNVMQTERISAAFIIEDGRPKGVITTLQLLNAGAG